MTKALQRIGLRFDTIRLYERRCRTADLVTVAVLVALGVALAVAVPRSGGFAFDVRATQEVQRLDGLSKGEWFFNDFLNDWGIPALWLASAGLYLLARRWDVALYFGLAFLLSPFTRMLKYTVDRERPSGPFDVLEFPADPSFPSGHVTTAIAFFGSWFILAPLLLPYQAVVPVRAVSIAAIGLTAFFRLWVGAHWLSDAVGSLLFGFALLLALLAAFALAGRLYRDRHESERSVAA